MYQVQQQQKQSSPGLCFKCRKPGHWFKECPENTYNRSPVSKPVFSDDECPRAQCLCGAGFCPIDVSHSVNNPGRKYYHCPGELEMNCGYFKWCDEVKVEEIREVPPLRYPICRCQAGVCVVLVEQNGVDAGRSYYACRIKKGDGACNFKQWVDECPEVASLGSDNLLAVQTNLMDEFELSSEGVMQLDAVEMNLCENKNIQKHRAQVEGEGEMPREACHLATEALAMENYVPEDMDLKMTIQSSESLTNQMCNSPVNSMQGYAAAAVAANNNGSPQGSLPNLNSVAEHLSPSNSQPRGGILLNLQSPLKAGLREGDMMSSSVSAKYEMLATHFQNELVTILESIIPQNHISMSKEAETAFAALNNLRVDYKPFQYRVNEYISRAASLARIEQIIEESSLHELVNDRNNLQQRLKELSKYQDEARAAFTASSSQLSSLYEKAAFAYSSEELMMELSSCEADNAARLEGLRQITKALTACKASLHAAEEVLKKSEETEMELNAAQVAFQIARAQLRN